MNKEKGRLYLDHMDQGVQHVNIIVGRFQPITLGHLSIINEMFKINGLPSIIIIIKPKVEVQDNKRPFRTDLQVDMIFDVMTNTDNLIDIMVLDGGASIDKIFDKMRPSYEPVLWGMGSDRLKSYSSQIYNETYRKDLNCLDEFRHFEVERNDKSISATSVRNALLDNDYDTFIKYTPSEIHPMYSRLVFEISPIFEYP